MVTHRYDEATAPRTPEGHDDYKHNITAAVPDTAILRFCNSSQYSDSAQLRWGAWDDNIVITFSNNVGNHRSLMRIFLNKIF